MFAFLDSPVEIGIVVLVVLLLFGGSQLPKLAKNLGQAQKEFKDGLSAGQKSDEAAAAAVVATPPSSRPRRSSSCPRRSPPRPLPSATRSVPKSCAGSRRAWPS